MTWLKYLLLFFATTCVAQIPLTGRVIDQANILSASEKAELETLLAEHEKATSNQIVVLTITSLDGQSVEEFSYQQGRKWGLGTKEKSNGVLFLVALNDRQVRIEVGYGLEDVLTDAQSKLIIERTIVPYFKQGQMSKGILQGAFAILQALGADLNSSVQENNPQDDSTNPWAIILLFALIGSFIFLRRWLGGGRGGFWRGGSSGGGSGFSGGGGSFGGGGSSGRW